MQRETSFTTTLPRSAATSTTTLDIDEGGSITTGKASAADKGEAIIAINADDSAPTPHSAAPRQSRLHGTLKSRRVLCSKRRLAFIALIALTLAIGNLIVLYVIVARQSSTINSVEEAMERQSSVHSSQHVHSHLRGRVNDVEEAQSDMVDRLDQLNRSITAMGMETSIELPNLYQRLEDIEAESKTMEANLSQLLNSTLGEQSAQLGARLKDFQAELESIEARVDEQGSQFGSKQANFGQRLEDLEDGLKPLEASFAQINSTLDQQSAQLANITRRVSGVEGRLGSLEANASKQSIAQMEHREKQVGRILKQWSQFKRLLYEKKDGPAPFGQKVIIRWAYVPRCLETTANGRITAADCDEKKDLQLWTFLPNGEIRQTSMRLHGSQCLVFDKTHNMLRTELSNYCHKFTTYWVYEYPTLQLMPFNNLLNGGEGGCLEIGPSMTELGLKACKEKSMLQRFKIIPVGD